MHNYNMVSECTRSSELPTHNSRFFKWDGNVGTITKKSIISNILTNSIFIGYIPGITKKTFSVVSAESNKIKRFRFHERVAGVSTTYITKCGNYKIKVIL